MLAVCTRAHTRSLARSCLQHRLGSKDPAMRAGELGSSLYRAALRGAALTAKGADGH